MIIFYIEWALSTLFGLLHARKYNSSWDDSLSRLIDSHADSAIISPSSCTVTLGRVEVWIENRFYAFGHLYGQGHEREFRPSIKTMAKLWNLVGPMIESAEKKKNDFSDIN